MKSKPFLVAALLFFCCVTGLRSQSVGIGTSTPDTSALLDIASTDKGILIPRMTTVQRNAIASPATGLMVYDTNLMGFWYYNGSSWLSVGGPDDKWKMYGNTGTNSTHFLGTSDDQPMRFRLNNLKAGTWDGANRNFGIGVGALDSITTGKGNIAIGTKALFRNKTQNGLIAIGDSSLYTNTTGVQNTAIGSKALRSNSSGSRNTANGFQALSSNTGSGNTAIGNNALRLNTSGNFLVAVGDSSLYSNTTGFQNTAIGSQALRRNITGYQNVAVGSQAMYNNTNGLNNVVIGHQALYSNISSSYNVAIGHKALYLNTSGSYNVAIGWSTLFDNTTGSSNVANGYKALHLNTTGEKNVASGHDALLFNTTGACNVANGFKALNDNSTGSKNSAFGFEANVATGGLVNATAIGASAMVGDSNCLVLGSISGVNGATESVNVGIGTTTPKTRLHIVGGSDANYIDTSGYLVTGDVAASNIIIDDNEIMARNNGASAPLYLQVSGGDLKIGSGAPSYKLEVGSSQAAKTAGGVWIAASDERLKKKYAHLKTALTC